MTTCGNCPTGGRCADCGSYIVGTDLRNTVTAWWGSTTPTGPLIDVSEMLQQMAAESTGTAAPIHLQGEPMAEHNVNRNVTGHGASTTWQNVCTCGWSGPQWRTDSPGVPPVSTLTDEAVAHVAQFKAPERPACPTKLRTATADYQCVKPYGHDGSHEADRMAWTDEAVLTPMPDPAMEHLRLYQAKRAEWLQAKHDADVAEKAVNRAYAAKVEAGKLLEAARAHRDGAYVSAENLQAELLALVKGEQA